MNRILTAVDPVLVDAYVCDMLHYDVSEVPYVGLAERLGRRAVRTSAKADISCLWGKSGGT